MMDERPPFIAEVEAALQCPIGPLDPVAGGDIAQSYSTHLQDGERLFIKVYEGEGISTDRQGIAPAEAAGLDWLRTSAALAVPEVRAFGEHWLALEWIETNASPPPRGSEDVKARTFEEQLGQGLAALHLAGADHFGWSRDNWIGRLPQSNAVRDRWADFLRDERWMPLILRATETGLLAPEERAALDALIEAFPSCLGPEEPPSRLHGDLWSGNCLRAANGSPWLIDPAVYGGHREVDLAMMKLFGGFSARTFAAYEEAAPGAPGAEERVPLYQVYPLLVHLMLFGRGYAGQLSDAVHSALDRAI